MNHESFLQSIVAAPTDEAPRLVYADWLEENGREGRAEFIRLSVLAQPLDWLGIGFYPPCKKYGKQPCNRCVKCSAFKRAGELFEAHGSEWVREDFGELINLVRVAIYARGFPVGIQVETSDWLARCFDFRSVAPLMNLAVVGLHNRSMWLRFRKCVSGLHVCMEGRGITNGLGLVDARSASRLMCEWAYIPRQLQWAARPDYLNA